MKTRLAAWLAVALAGLACGAPTRSAQPNGGADVLQPATLDEELKDAAARAEAEAPCAEHPELDCRPIPGRHHPDRALAILRPALVKWGEQGRLPLQSAARLLVLRGRMKLGQHDEATASFESAHDLYEGAQRLAEDDVLTAAKYGIAMYARHKHPADAERLDDETVAILTRLHGEDSAQVHHALLLFAEIKRRACNASARTNLERVQQSASRTRDTDLELTVLHERAWTEAKLEQHRAALELIDQSLALARGDEARFAKEFAGLYGSGAAIAWESGDLNRVLSYSDSLLNLERQAAVPHSPAAVLQAASVLALRGDEARLAALTKETGLAIDIRPIKTVEVPGAEPRSCRPNTLYGWRALNALNDELVAKCPDALKRSPADGLRGLVRLDVASDGAVARAMLASNGYPQSLRTCVLDVVTRATFPRTEPGGERMFVFLVNHHFWLEED